MNDKLYFTLEYDITTYGGEDNFADVVISFDESDDEHWKVAEFLYDYIKDDLGIRNSTEDIWIDSGMLVISLYDYGHYDFYRVVSSFKKGVYDAEDKFGVDISFDIYDDGVE